MIIQPLKLLLGIQWNHCHWHVNDVSMTGPEMFTVGKTHLLPPQKSDMGVEPKIGGGILPPKMDGENNSSKPYEQMGWFGGFQPHIFASTPKKKYQKMAQHLLQESTFGSIGAHHFGGIIVTVSKLGIPGCQVTGVS